MKRIQTTVIAVSAALLLSSAAHAQVTLNSVRVGAKDTVALAKFYQAAFGMQEGFKVLLEADPQVQKAEEAIPQARALYQNVRKIVAQRAGGSMDQQQ